MDGSRRRKSIIIIDKKGNTEEVMKKSNKSDNNPGAKKSIESKSDSSEEKNGARNVPDKSGSGAEDGSRDDSEHEEVHGSATRENGRHQAENENESSSKMSHTKQSERNRDKSSKENEKIDKLSQDQHMSDSGDNSSRNIDKSTSSRDKAKMGAAVAATASSAGHAEHKSKEDNKKVQFSDEKKEYNVDKDPNKSIPLSEEEKMNANTAHVKNLSLEDVGESYVPFKIPGSELPDGSSILKGRTDGNIVAEGHMWKRRLIFNCFWHQKYLILTKNNFLVYHKANGTRPPKGNWDLNKANDIQGTFAEGAKHPYRLAIELPFENLLFGFDEKDDRDYWFDEINRIIEKNKGKQ